MSFYTDSAPLHRNPTSQRVFKITDAASSSDFGLGNISLDSSPPDMETQDQQKPPARRSSKPTINKPVILVTEPRVYPVVSPSSDVRESRTPESSQDYDSDFDSDSEDFKTHQYRKAAKLTSLLGEEAPVDISLAEINAQGLEALLLSKVPLAYFLASAMREHSNENIFFLLEVEHFVSSAFEDTDQQVRAAKRIASTYVAEDGSFQVNLNGAIVSRINCALEHPSATAFKAIFNEAVDEVSIMVQSSYKSFKLSDLHRLMQENLLGKQVYDDSDRETAAALLTKQIESKISEAASRGNSVSAKRAKVLLHMVKEFCIAILGVEITAEEAPVSPTSKEPVSGADKLAPPDTDAKTGKSAAAKASGTFREFVRRVSGSDASTGKQSGLKAFIASATRRASTDNRDNTQVQGKKSFALDAKRRQSDPGRSKTSLSSPKTPREGNDRELENAYDEKDSGRAHKSRNSQDAFYDDFDDFGDDDEEEDNEPVTPSSHDLRILKHDKKNASDDHGNTVSIPARGESKSCLEVKTRGLRKGLGRSTPMSAPPRNDPPRFTSREQSLGHSQRRPSPRDRRDRDERRRTDREDERRRMEHEDERRRLDRREDERRRLDREDERQRRRYDDREATGRRQRRYVEADDFATYRPRPRSRDKRSKSASRTRPRMNYAPPVPGLPYGIESPGLYSPRDLGGERSATSKRRMYEDLHIMPHHMKTSPGPISPAIGGGGRPLQKTDIHPRGESLAAGALVPVGYRKGKQRSFTDLHDF